MLSWVENLIDDWGSLGLLAFDKCTPTDFKELGSCSAILIPDNWRNHLHERISSFNVGESDINTVLKSPEINHIFRIMNSLTKVTNWKSRNQTFNHRVMDKLMRDEASVFVASADLVHFMKHCNSDSSLVIEGSLNCMAYLRFMSASFAQCHPRSVLKVDNLATFTTEVQMENAFESETTGVCMLLVPLLRKPFRISNSECIESIQKHFKKWLKQVGCITALLSSLLTFQLLKMCARNVLDFYYGRRSSLLASHEDKIAEKNTIIKKYVHWHKTAEYTIQLLIVDCACDLIRKSHEYYKSILAEAAHPVENLVLNKIQFCSTLHGQTSALIQESLMLMIPLIQSLHET